MADTAQYTLPIVRPGQYRSSIGWNEWLLWLDWLMNAQVVNDNLTTPPAVTSADWGKAWILSGTGTGDWSAGSADDVALLVYGAWYIKTPKKGLLVRDNDGAGAWLKWNGTAWSTAAI